MPTIAQIGIPLPATFDELESIACDYFTYTYSMPFQKWGRSGQTQFGIDICGKTLEGKNIGIQCKHYLNTKLTEDVLLNDIRKTENIDPPLDVMYFVTTAPRDVTIQNFCRTWKGKFPVEIYYWEVFEKFLLLHPQIKDLYYPKQIVDDVTQLFVNDFLKLCNKYYIYHALYETDYVAPYNDMVFEMCDLFYNEITALLVSDKSLNVDKVVLRDIQQFKDGFEYMIMQAALCGYSNGGNVCVPRFPEDEREELETFFMNSRKELIKIYSKYKF